MKNYIVCLIIKLFIVLLFFGCSNPYELVFTPQEEEELSPILMEIDTRLPIDENGYPLLYINPNTYQTLHRIKGYLTRDDKPVNIVKVGWWSNHYWEYDGFDVPIVNGSSYSNEDGEVNTMLGVIGSMVGDTITIYYGYYDDWTSEETYGEFQIIIK